MLERLNTALRRFEARLRDRYGSDISTPAARRAAWWHFQLIDHAFLRVFWTNLDTVAEGVYRSNQPSPARLERYRDMGIRTVINLRGAARSSPILFEAEACARLGLRFVSVEGFSARRLPELAAIRALEALFRSLPRPFVMHCKSGSDRAGLASALYLLLIEGRPAAEAARQLHWRYIHLKRTDTGVLDHMLRVYAREGEARGIAFTDWLEAGYDPAAITRSFEDWRLGRAPREG